eukprot:EG_transcript_21206
MNDYVEKKDVVLHNCGRVGEVGSHALEKLEKFTPGEDVPQMFLSNFFGFISICIWVFVQLPQIIKNHQRKHTDDLSIHFLMMWMLGDTCNLLGLLFVQGTPPQIILGIYSVEADWILLVQWWWFTKKSEEDSTKKAKYLWPALIAAGVFAFIQAWARGVPFAVIGDYFGWVSGLLYMGSRIPQLVHTFSSKHVEDISIWLFVFSILGNSAYSASLLCRSLQRAWLRKQAPFLVGSFGMLSLDVLMLLQIVAFRAPTDHLPLVRSDS